MIDTQLPTCKCQMYHRLTVGIAVGGVDSELVGRGFLGARGVHCY